MTSKCLRIISTVPSITELLYDLEMEEQVVGITKFCVHPEEWYRSKTRIGGTKNLNLEKIMALQPDLIIANKEENTKDQIETLMDYTQVIVTDIKTIEDNIKLISTLGALLNKEALAQKLSNQLSAVISGLKPVQTASAVYLIWKDPYMTVGGDSFINHMLDCVGFKNVFGHLTRYPEVTINDIKQKKPQFILLSSEPFPFKEKHIAELQNELPDAKILLVDGEAFSWYGSRIIKKAKYLKSINSKIQTFAE
ncbi:MAG: ABC transporter substrate-binding protein [Saprospiraceae bacterium]|nr:ABC transporter substrate-binding protein [Saprospiraceae bacterium]